MTGMVLNVAVNISIAPEAERIHGFQIDLPLKGNFFEYIFSYNC